MKTELICIECPMGCRISVETEDGRVLSSSGYGCKRGKLYAEQEVVRPMRVLTTTLRCEDGRMIAVKSAGPIARDELLSVMRELRDLHPRAPIALGQVLLKDLREGVDLIAADRLD